ncbi:MAG TPA: hypothetical protein VKV27_16525 [Solirubrobacteraceae bacterium]|nr:hypothetical protein [Solirubrobacteraceae bacterium]
MLSWLGSGWTGGLVKTVLRLFTLNWSPPTTAQQAHDFFGWFLAIPWADIAQKLAGALAVTQAIGLGALALTVTVEIARSVLVGFGPSSQTVPVIAISRTVIAGVLVVLWPGIFHQGAVISDDLSSALFPMSSAQAAASVVFVWSSASVATLGVGGLLIMILGGLVVFALIAMKVILVLGLAICLVAMPVVLALLPVSDLGRVWLTLSQTWMLLLAWPSVWATCLLVFAGVGQGIFSASLKSALATNSGPLVVIAAAIGPISSLVMLYLCVRLPTRVLQMVMAVNPLGRAIAGVEGHLPLGRIVGMQLALAGLRGALGGHAAPASASARAAGSATGATGVGASAAAGANPEPAWAPQAKLYERNMRNGLAFTDVAQTFNPADAASLERAFSALDVDQANELHRLAAQGDIRSAVARDIAAKEHAGVAVPKKELLALGVAASDHRDVFNQAYWGSLEKRLSGDASFNARRWHLRDVARGFRGHPRPYPGPSDPQALAGLLNGLDPHGRDVALQAAARADYQPLVMQAALSEVAGDERRMDAFMRLAALERSQMKALAASAANAPAPAPRVHGGVRHRP